MMASDTFHAPLQLKGEVLDLEFTLDSDHRKRRRNRTTQSCLNCHTSKRKCDRKRPCQRCIQLGLTGLCVYEVDDPALRDDPSIDESTRLRNRIAELESLVRELRGKPHPRWAESNFRDGDPNEKWHSRATKCPPHLKRRTTPEIITDTTGGSTRISGAASFTTIKTESPSDGARAPLYRFSPSPPPPMRYPNYQSDLRASSAASFESGSHPPYAEPSSSLSPSHPYHPSSSSAAPFSGHRNSAASSSYADSGGGYPLPEDNADRMYGDHYSPDPSPFCACRTNPATGNTYIALSNQLQSTLNSLRHYTHHPADTQCLLYRRIIELNNLMQISGQDDSSDASYHSHASTPTDSDTLSPLSASSTHTSFHGGSSGGVSPQEWNALAAAGYNPYFPLQPGEQGMYNHVVT